jgi:hypothetical protein
VQLKRNSILLLTQEETIIKMRLSEEEHNKQVAEINHNVDVKLKELVDLQARHALSLETAGSEARMLKDEIRNLQVQNELLCSLNVNNCLMLLYHFQAESVQIAGF